MTGNGQDAVRTITAEALAPERFAPFGVVLQPTPDGSPPLSGEDRLDLSRGTPRFYLMTLEDKPPHFTSITRHRRVTQCLAAVGGGEWLLAVAPPGDPDDPDVRPALADVAGFVVPGDVAVLLHRGTWHAGPFFTASSMAFFNLELADTNVVDHQSHSFVGDGLSHCTLVRG